MSAITAGGCAYCGSYWHSGMCPRVESIEYHRDGSLAKVTLRDEQPPGAMSVTVQHTFLGRLDRDCELCGKPDRDAVHYWPPSVGDTQTRGTKRYERRD